MQCAHFYLPNGGGFKADGFSKSNALAATLEHKTMPNFRMITDVKIWRHKIRLAKQTILSRQVATVWFTQKVKKKK